MDRSRTRREMRETYDRIAPHFAKTRAHAWSDVTAFLERVDESDSARGAYEVGLDVGCGNGRHAARLAERATRVLGVDASQAVLAQARKRAVEQGYNDRLALLQGDAAALPIASHTIDLVLYVATIHHLPDRETRVGSLDELARVLAPGGLGLVSAWSVTHDRFDRERGFDTDVDWTLPDGETVPRYYHIYDPEEFRRDLEASALYVDRTFVSQGNCYGEVCPPDSEGRHRRREGKGP